MMQFSAWQKLSILLVSLILGHAEAALDPSKLIASYFTPESFQKSNATNGESIYHDQSGNNHQIDGNVGALVVEEDYVHFNHGGGVWVNSLKDYEWGDTIGVIFWFRRASPGAQGNQGIVGNADDYDRGSWSAFIRSKKYSGREEATFGVEVNIDAGEQNFDGLRVETEKWHMGVFTKSSSILNFYYDSIKVTFNGKFDWPAPGDLIPSNLPLQLGGKVHGGEYFVGDLKNVYIYRQFIGRDDVCLLWGCDTLYPTPAPTVSPPGKPTPEPTHSAKPSASPTPLPTYTPSQAPTLHPTPAPTPQPTHKPYVPTPAPTRAPTPRPSQRPSARPTRSPTMAPSPGPTAAHGTPSLAPTLSPTHGFTTKPTSTPSSAPSPKPTVATKHGDEAALNPSGMTLSQKLGMGFGIALFVLTCAAIGYLYRGKLEGYWKGTGDKEPKAVEVIMDRKRNNNEEEDSDEEEVDPGDAYERWMAVVERKRNSVSRDTLDDGEAPTTENPLHGMKDRQVQAISGDEEEGGVGAGRENSPVVVGRLSTSDDDNSLQSLYKEQDSVVVMRRLSQELGTSESLEEAMSSKKRSSVEGRGSSIKNVDLAGSGLTSREQALMRSAMASQSVGKNRQNALKRGSTLGGRGAAMRRPSQKYVPPSSPSVQDSNDMNDAL